MNAESATRERLLTPAEVAEMLGVSEGTLAVWRCVRRYPLAFIKVGRSVRYRASDVSKFIESRTQSCEVVVG